MIVACEQCMARDWQDNMIPLGTGGHICKSHFFAAEIDEMSKRHHAEIMDLRKRINEFQPD